MWCRPTDFATVLDNGWFEHHVEFILNLHWNLKYKFKKIVEARGSDDDDVLRDAKTSYTTRIRNSENISLKNETRLTDFSAHALPMLNLIAVCSVATGGRDLTVMRSFYTFHAAS